MTKARTPHRQERDGPTKEQATKHAYEPVYAEKGGKGERHKVQTVRRLDASPQDVFLRRKLITQRQRDAADRFYEDWYLAGLDPRTTGHYGDISGQGENTYGMARTEGQVRARERHRNAYAVMDPRIASVVVGMICDEQTAVQYGACFGLSGKQASGGAMLLLRFGLDDLVKHYGL